MHRQEHYGYRGIGNSSNNSRSGDHHDQRSSDPRYRANGPAEADVRSQNGMPRRLGDGQRENLAEDRSRGIGVATASTQADANGNYAVYSADYEHRGASQDSSYHGQQPTGAQDHVINDGTGRSDPMHAYGRRRQEYVTTQECLTDEGYELDETLYSAGRRHATPVDHVFTEVLAPLDPRELNVKVTPEDMRNAIREWLVMEYDMKILNPEKWEEVEIAPKGTHWVASCLTSHSRTLARDGATAQQIALKLSQMPIAELRFFGVRFRHQDEPRSPQLPSRGLKNPSLVSPGVAHAMGNAVSSEQGPNQVEGRQYISSGKSHWEYMNLGDKAEGVPYGHPRTDTYKNGIERGIGYGRKHIEVPTHFEHGLNVTHSPQQEARGYVREGGMGFDRTVRATRTPSPRPREHMPPSSPDHMINHGTAEHQDPGEARGKPRDDEFEDGMLPRGIGHGRRHIGVQDRVHDYLHPPQR